MGFHGKTQLGGKAQGAQHAHRVFFVAGGRVANHAQGARFKVFHAIAVVNDGKVLERVVEGVDGEVAAHGIGFESAIDIVAQQHAVFIACTGGGLFVVATEGGDFDNLAPH